MPFRIMRGDITEMKTEAIVNAANTALAPGAGICGNIFRKAGYNELRKECLEIGYCRTGMAVITNGYNLPARYIIHTPGPIYDSSRDDNESLLRSCYKSSLELAKERNIGSIAFPLISAGIYGYPPDKAMKVAVKAISDFLNENDMYIYLVLYDNKILDSSMRQYNNIRKYIERNLLRENKFLHDDAAKPMYAPSAPKEKFTVFGREQKTELDKIILEMDSSFSEYLLYLIDERGMKDSQVYKRANIDRKLFSKLRSNPQYKPSKLTAVALALALELDLDGVNDLIGRAGYTLSHSSKFDIIVEYFIINGNYNIFEINEVLFAFDQQLIGA